MGMVRSEHMARLGAAIREAAHYRGRSTDWIAEQHGASAETVRRVMRGDHELTISLAFEYLDLLDAPREWVVRPPETPERALRMMAEYDHARGLP